MSIEKEYTELLNNRQFYEERAEKCAKVTLPFLWYPSLDKRKEAAQTQDRFQNIGSQVVNHLAARLVLALFPSNTPFFRLQLNGQDNPSFEGNKKEIDAGLMKLESFIVKEMEAGNDRIALNDAIKQLIVTGNVCLHFKHRRVEVYPLTQYCVMRRSDGIMQKLILQESVKKSACPVEWHRFFKEEDKEDDNKQHDPETILFTKIYREHDHYLLTREINGNAIKGADETYPLHACPYVPVRFLYKSFEHYGRSYVDDYVDDLTTLEKLSKALVRSAHLATKHIGFVNPNGVTKINNLAKAKDGDWIPGSLNDVALLQSNKHADLQTASNMISLIERRIAKAFLMSETVQRQAERVTAEEIRFMANELEEAIGGVYSVLSQELQVPYVNVRLSILQRENIIAPLPKDSLEPTIVTGIEALSRNHESQKLTRFIRLATGTLGPEVTASFLKPSAFLERMAIAEGLDPKLFIKTNDELMQEQQQQQMAMQQQAEQQQNPTEQL